VEFEALLKEENDDPAKMLHVIAIPHNLGIKVEVAKTSDAALAMLAESILML